ncbi:unnamed protein product [Caenorhabditis sp. 36 PRJEB53466]|nr:unnamed protein product [Caenorhabditis sp. 36 PRJEB53466]
MHISQLIENLTEKAVITPLTPSSVIVFDKNELKVYLGFTNNRGTVEYAKEVILLLSTPIQPKAEIRQVVVSKNGDYAILEGSRSVYVVRIGTEILVSKPDRLPNECFCECYPLHDSFLLQNSSLSVVQTRILSQKCDEKTIAAILYSDNCIRFYNIYRKSEALLLTIDFRHHLHQSHDESVSNNTFGLQKALVSFDMIPPQPKTSYLSLIVVDSDAEFFASFVYFSCFKEGISPRIHRLETVDSLPCDPLALHYLETSNPRISSVFALVSGGGVLSHLVVFPNEFGEFQLLVNDQLRLPDCNGDPRIVPNQIRKLNRNRYEIATSTCLFSVNISPWFDNILSGSSDPKTQETRVCELVNVVTDSAELSVSSKKPYTGARALRAVSVLLARHLEQEEDENDVNAEPEVLHLVILSTTDGEPTLVFSVSTFDNHFGGKTGAHAARSSDPAPATTVKSSSTLEQQLAELKPLPACVISDRISPEEAIAAALKFVDSVDERLKKHGELANAVVERCLGLAATSQLLDEKQQSVDERLIAETTAAEELKVRMHELKARMDATRKAANVLFHRVDENVPLSDNEVRIYERLKEHQKMLSDMSIYVPKMTLDSNELHRMAEVVEKRRGGEEPSKFANIEKNAIDIENLEKREIKLNSGISEFAV